MENADIATAGALSSANGAEAIKRYAPTGASRLTFSLGLLQPSSFSRCRPCFPSRVSCLGSARSLSSLNAPSAMSTA